jgi:polar amino acid transport system substrate-binding protein
MKRVMFAIFGMVIGLSSAWADGLSDVKSRGVLICGVLGDLVPLGYEDPKTRSLVGLDVDICGAIAQDLGVKLELKAVSVDARIPSLVTGHVDVMTASLAYTAARAKQIDFSSAYMSVPVSILVKKDSGIKSFADLAGKKVSANRGSTSEVFARQKLKSTEVIALDNGPASYLALMQDKVQGMSMVKSAGIGQTEFLDEALFWEHDCIGVRKGESALLSAVNVALDKLESSGRLQTIWDRWYGPATEYKLTRDKKVTAAAEFQQ